jgi:hypothetical protein
MLRVQTARYLALLCTLSFVATNEDDFHHRGREELPAPDFFMIGAGKSGTTSLHDLLVTHPEICSTGHKEHHYFSSAVKWNAGSKQYLKDFNKTDCGEGGYTIDSTPRYYRVPQAVTHLQRSYSEEDLKKKKFILLIKEPVAREFSWFKQVVRYCRKTMLHAFEKNKPENFTSQGKKIYGFKSKVACDPKECHALGCGDVPYNETLMKTPEVYLDSFQSYYQNKRVHGIDSVYGLHIRHWLKIISRKQLFVLNSQTLYENTPDTMKRLSKFLGLKSDWGKDVKLPHANPNVVKAVMPCKVHDKLSAFFKPYNRDLYAYLEAHKGPKSEPPFPKFESSRAMCTA